MVGFSAIPDWSAGGTARSGFGIGAGVAVADLDGDGTDDLVVLRVDTLSGQNAGYYRVGRNLDDEGAVTGGWGPWQEVPDWFSWENAGAGISVADIDGDGRPDLVVFMVDAPAGANAGYYRVGWAVDGDGVVTGGWGPWQEVPNWFSWENAGADITVADIDGDGRPDLVVFMVDAPAGANAGFYRSGTLGPTGAVVGWRPWTLVPDWRFWENAGAGIAVADLDGDGVPELLVLTVDAPAGANAGYYSVGWGLDEQGRPARGWGPWEAVPEWRFWENAGAGAVLVDLDRDGEPELLVLTVDAPDGEDVGYLRIVPVVTDLAEAATRGVWRLLETDTGVLAVHAALLHTGSVMFFAGSSNDPEAHADHAYGTRVWHYPSPYLSSPQTPVDLFCCGHAFTADGRLLAVGGTEAYDPFHGLRQAVIFDQTLGPVDPASPTGTTGAWLVLQDMADGRWYPTVVALPDARELAVSGLGSDGTLNVVPEVRDGTSWAPLPPSPPWPMYAHLFLLADGRLFYSGGQYGGNNGLRPAVWDPATNAVHAVDGLPDPMLRNQCASVLLPPAQEQRVMVIGGGGWEVNAMAPATATTAVVDLREQDPVYRQAAPLHTARMHLCAVLLPDRTVLVNGGAAMEESAALAALAAEIYDPELDEWTVVAASRVPRLYHSVSLLMPDGRVVTAGSNPQRLDEELRIEVYSPPYLFAGPRPECTPERVELHHGEVLRVRVTSAADLSSACLIRPGATTHSCDVEQRLVDLPFLGAGDDPVELTLPTEPGVAPPGWYLLFVLSSAGVPSQGAWVHLT